MARDWFRCRTWEEEDQAQFEARLARARPTNRSQYLRIQGVHLEEAGLLREAAELFRRVIDEYPESIDVAVALHETGLIRLQLGETTEALAALRQAIANEEARPVAQTDAGLDFALAVARLGVREAYDEALSVLDRSRRSGRDAAPFPIQAFKRHAAMAIILSDRGDSRASDEAAKALREASRETSGFRSHAHLGLAGGAHVELRSRLRGMLGG